MAFSKGRCAMLVDLPGMLVLSSFLSTTESDHLGILIRL